MYFSMIILDCKLHKSNLILYLVKSRKDFFSKNGFLVMSMCKIVWHCHSPFTSFNLKLVWNIQSYSRLNCLFHFVNNFCFTTGVIAYHSMLWLNQSSKAFSTHQVSFPFVVHVMYEYLCCPIFWIW